MAIADEKHIFDDAPNEMLAPAASSLTDKELKARRKADRERKAKYRAREKERQSEVAAIAWDSPEALDKKTAWHVVREQWDIRTINVLNQAVEWGMETAQDLRLTPNWYFWANGPKAVLACKQDTQPEEKPPTAETGDRSEVLTRRELYCLFSFSCTGKKILGRELSFDEWLGSAEVSRDRARKDWYWESKEVLGIPLEETVHREIADNFYPHLNADGMFPPDYTLSDVHAAIAKQNGDGPRSFMLLDPRTFMKTAGASSFTVQFFLNFPDSRVFCVSGTDPLAAGFLRLVKTYFAKARGAAPSVLHLLYPEYILWDEDPESEMPIVLPCRKWPQRDHSLTAVGLFASSSGLHSDLYIADDVVQSPGSETTRATLKRQADTLDSNIPLAHSLKITLGTRYELTDYYSHRIAVWAEDLSTLVFKCRGVLTPKDGFEHVPVQDLRMEQCEMLWPNRAGTPEKTWKDLKLKMRVNLEDFLHQQMNSPLAPNADDTLAFDVDVLNEHIKEPSIFPPGGDTYLVCDIAHSLDSRADYTVLIAGRVVTNEENELSLYVIYIDAQRRRNSDLAIALAEASRRFRPKTIIIEKLAMHDLLIEETKRQAQIRGVSLAPIYLSPISTRKDAKFMRIKASQILLQNNRLYFSSSAGMIPLMVDQYMKYSGKRSSTRHDDVPDAVSLLCQHVIPATDTSAKNVEIRKRAEEEIENQRRMAEQYAAIFGQDRAYGGHLSHGSQWRVGDRSTDPTPDLGPGGVIGALSRGGFVNKLSSKTVGFKDLTKNKKN